MCFERDNKRQIKSILCTKRISPDRSGEPGEEGVQQVQSFFLSNIRSSLDGKQMALVDWHQVAVIHHHLRCSILHRD